MTFLTAFTYIVILEGMALKIFPIWVVSAIGPITLSFAVVKGTSKFADTANFTPAMSKAIALA